MALGVALEQAAGIGELDMIADAGEDVEKFTLLGNSIGGAVGGDERDAEVSRTVDGGLIVGLLVTLVVALQFGIEVLGTEDVEQALAGMAGDAGGPGKTRRSRRAWRRLHPSWRAVSCE